MTVRTETGPGTAAILGPLACPPNQQSQLRISLLHQDPSPLRSAGHAPPPARCRSCLRPAPRAPASRAHRQTTGLGEKRNVTGAVSYTAQLPSQARSTSSQPQSRADLIDHARVRTMPPAGLAPRGNGGAVRACGSVGGSAGYAGFPSARSTPEASTPRERAQPPTSTSLGSQQLRPLPWRARATPADRPEGTPAQAPALRRRRRAARRRGPSRGQRRTVPTTRQLIKHPSK